MKCDYYMPPNDEDILMHYEPHIVTEFYYNPIVTEFYDIYADCIYNNIKEDAPTYWMPLPERPKMDGGR